MVSKSRSSARKAGRTASVALARTGPRAKSALGDVVEGAPIYNAPPKAKDARTIADRLDAICEAFGCREGLAELAESSGAAEPKPVYEIERPAPNKVRLRVNLPDGSSVGAGGATISEAFVGVAKRLQKFADTDAQTKAIDAALEATEDAWGREVSVENLSHAHAEGD